VSAITGEGQEALAQRVEDEFQRTLRPVELLLPYDEGGRLAELHDLAGEIERTDTADGVHVRARVPAAVAERYERFSVGGNGAQASDAA
jgi:GTP-binding protein HflX